MRKKYPSQIRYEEKNPAITFRMKEEEKERIVLMAEKSGKSISELVRMALLGFENKFNKAVDETAKKMYPDLWETDRITEFMDGEKYGRKEWGIWVICYICKKMLYIKPISKNHIMIIEEMTGKLKHDQCPKD
jgi:hypothetical protein